MSAALGRAVLWAGVGIGVAGLAYLALYSDHLLVIHRSVFFRLGLGMTLSALLVLGQLIVPWIPPHTGHAILAFTLASVIRSVASGVAPQNEAWFDALF